jgi:hypothetical protein
MPLMPTMATRGRLLTTRTVSPAGCAACLNTPSAILVCYAFDLEARQVEGNRLDVIALLVTRTSHQFTLPHYLHLHINCGRTTESGQVHRRRNIHVYVLNSIGVLSVTLHLLARKLPTE